MDKTVQDAIKTLISNPDALTEFEQWVDGANRTIKDSGAVTRTDGSEADAPLTLETLAATVAALSAKLDGFTVPATSTEAPTIELDEAAANGIAQAVFSGAEFRSLTDGVARLSGALEAQAKTLLESVEALTKRVAALEKDDSEKLREHEEMKPAGNKITLAWRAPRGKDEAKPVAERTVSLANAASKTEQAWNSQ